MSPDSKLSLLCRLVDNLPELETTKTKERDLLISLSQVTVVSLIESSLIHYFLTFTLSFLVSDFESNSDLDSRT